MGRPKQIMFPEGRFKGYVYFIYALLFEDGTAYIGQTGNLERGARAVRRQFGNSGRIALLQTYRTFLEQPGRPEVYQWRFRLGLEGICIRAVGTGELYHVGEETLWPELVSAARKLELGQEVLDWLDEVIENPIAKEVESETVDIRALLQALLHEAVAAVSNARRVPLHALDYGFKMVSSMLRAPQRSGRGVDEVVISDSCNFFFDDDC